ncbi:MAG: DNA polymerase III subunit delta [Bacteroidales bacterium]|nr:DNA polymerase III subunit delta [Bacteroidales bacterium]
MAKGFKDTDSLCRGLVSDALKGVFRPVYLLMGEEPYYIDMVCDAVVENALDESERDFNQTICFGSDVNAEDVVTAARRYPMMAERQLVVVKEAQVMRDFEALAAYCEKPLDSTVLVICLKGKNADRRKALYKSVSKSGVVVESAPVRDYELPQWISAYYRDLGLDITPDAVALLAESVGCDLAKIRVETTKMQKNIPEGTTKITAADIEKNVGISRQWSVFELNLALSNKDAAKALKIASHMGSAHGFAMPAATGMLFIHFYRILKYHALLRRNPNPPSDEKARILGVSPYFFREYDQAVRNYPLGKAMEIVSLLKEYDFKGKGGESGEATPGDLFVELVARILS